MNDSEAIEGGKSSLSIDKLATLSILRPGGALSAHIKGYEARSAQVEMMADVIDAYNEQSIALIEAGTGTGKSVAYLMPALVWAAKNQERTVVSTHTITLQEQLLNKDIPFLLDVLKLDLKVVLVKGMNNYLCLRKLEDTIQEKVLLPIEEQEEVDKLALWRESSHGGSKSELPFTVSSATWEHVLAESDACSHAECPHYKECYFFKARRNASDAHVLVVNHHLLCADLSSRKESIGQLGGGILPPYEHVVIDEAHHLEDVATEYFASRIIKFDLLKLLSRLSSDKKGPTRQSKLTFLLEKLQEAFRKNHEQIISIVNRIEIDLTAAKLVLSHLVQDLFQAAYYFFNHLGRSKSEEIGEVKWRLYPEHLEHAFWLSEVQPKAQALVIDLRRYIDTLIHLESDLHALKNDKLNEKTKSVRLDIQGIVSRLKKVMLDLEKFVSKEFFENHVKWMEMRSFRSVTNMFLVGADLNIAKVLQEALFNPFSTIVLCSATLTTNKSFHFIKKRLGLIETDKKVIEKVYDSPFNYAEQALLVIPKDVPFPNDKDFVEKASEIIWNALQASQGQAFILFTSFQMLQKCHACLKDRLVQARYPIFVQGEGMRKAMLDDFKKTKHSVLFGTDSFWEGVDVVGDALRCVIIMKLPFKVPSEPIIQARSEMIEKEGGDPFMDYSVPSAIVKFKQGFGRLIRNRKDRGCVVCLDARLLNKAYGKLFLQSLPACATCFEESSLIQEKMKAFYYRKKANNF
ncbi:MAG: helicase C-terminal domain-containing protein [Chlamydiales bacterium]|nr:helicase C-terminal domain-containing protein [Chlamydiales bacterium]